MSPTILSVGIFSMFVLQCSAGGFLEIANMSTEELESSLLSELAEAVSHDAGHQERISSFKVLLKPMYDAAPHEADGTMSHAVVRYVLHRFFAKHHGWFMRGLEPNNGIQYNNEGLQDIKEWIPDYLQAFLENMSGKHGLSLQELAVFAATLEDFVHKEEKQWLKQVYGLLWHPLDSQLNKSDVKEVLETYLMMYNLDSNFSVPTPSKVREMLSLFSSKVKGWEDTVSWFTKVQDSAWGPDADRTADFEETQRLVKAVDEDYGTFNDGECLKMKTELLSVESKKPGRVRLTDFYKKSLYGSWEFNEKIEYLRSLGALDESDPTTPLVIIPNYVASRPQCLVSSNFYALCCRNECEDLLGSLERSIKSSHTAPSEIIKLVEALPTSTITAPRTLSQSLLSRLQDVATLNGGQVPLHGRLFAQWLHHAFPRECPFPHVGGTTNPQTADEWIKSTGHEDSKASEEEMMSHVERDTCKFSPHGMECTSKHSTSESENEEENEDLPWSQVEELLVVRAAPVQASGNSKAYGRDLVVYFVLSAIMSILVWVSKDFIKSRQADKNFNFKSISCTV